jgi:hypothetical protein
MSSISEENGMDGSSNQMRNILIGLVVSIALLTLVLIGIAVFLILNAGTAGPAVQVIRDFTVTLLAFAMILIMTAITVLAIQVARFVNLMTNEVRPILNTANDTVNTVRGTAEFLSKHVTEPVITTSSAIGGIAKVVGDVDTLRKAAGIVMQAYAAGSPTGARAEGNPAAESPAAPDTSSASTPTSSQPEANNAASVKDNF